MFLELEASTFDDFQLSGLEVGDVAKKYDLDAGVIVNEVDTAAFVARVRPLHDQFAEELGPEAVELVRIIREEAKNVK
jgi:TRAP-type C4-dicarboxylate transport system substrate-binding protein